MAGRSAVISVIVTGEATGATKAFADGEKAAKGFKEQVDKTSKGFDGVRDSADNTERRITGFRDSLTGTGDVMKGLRDGDMITLATGFADLSSSVANLGADLLDWGKKAVDAGKNFVTSQAASTAAKVKDVAVDAAHKAAAVASTVATQAQTAAQWLLNAAMNANPILLIVVAIAALTAAFVVAYKESETFRNIVNGAVEAVKNVIMGAYNWVRDNWPLLLAILTGPFGLAVLAITRNWDAIKGAATGAKDWIKARVDDIVGFFTGLPGRVQSAATGAFGFLYSSLKSVINQMIDAWNKLGDTFIIRFGGWDPPGPGSIPGFTSPRLLPRITPLAAGGITMGPMLSLLGDNRSGNEAVIPLDSPRAAGMLGGGTTIIIQGDVYGEADFLRKLENGVEKLKKQGSSALAGLGA